MNHFCSEKIDRAIVMTQYDLRGFAHPLGFRMEKCKSAKCNSFIPGNLVAFAAGFGLGEEGKQQLIPDAFVDYTVSSFEQCLAMCKKFASDCDLSQKEAIQLIILDIFQQNEEMKKKVVAGEIEDSAYLTPLDKDYWWGKIVLALAESFEVSLA